MRSRLPAKRPRAIATNSPLVAPSSTHSRVIVMPSASSSTPASTARSPSVADTIPVDSTSASRRQ